MIGGRNRGRDGAKSDYVTPQERKIFDAVQLEAEKTGALGPALTKAGVSECQYAQWLNRFAAASYDPTTDLDAGRDE